MQTLDALQRKINSITELKSVVKTMKAMASVRIKQYEKAVAALRDYTHVIELGFQVLLSHPEENIPTPPEDPSYPIGAVVFGSDQGMCGQLNDIITQKVLKDLSDAATPPKIIAVGDRVKRKLENAVLNVHNYIRVPGSASGISSRVEEILTAIHQWQLTEGPHQVWLYYSLQPETSGFSPHAEKLLPIDRRWINHFINKPWPNHCLPAYTLDFNTFFSSLIRQYLFSSIFRAFAESMASENQSRLQSMQHAEKNIREELDELTQAYHHRRQMSITEELLDIVSGFEALGPS